MDTPTPQPTSDAKRDETVLWTKDAILEKAKIDMPDYVSTLTVNHALEFEEHVIVGKSHTKFDLPKTALTDMLLVGFYEGYGMDQRLPVYAFVYEVKRNQVGYTTLKNDANHIRLRFDYMSDINFWKPLCNIGEVLKKFAPVVSALRAFILCQFVLAGYLRNICGYTSFWSELESACKAISDSRPAQSKTPQSSAPRLGKNPATFSAPGKDGSSTAATSRCQETAVSQPQPNSAQSTENSRKRKHDEVENSNSCKSPKENTRPPYCWPSKAEIRRRDYSVPVSIPNLSSTHKLTSLTSWDDSQRPFPHPTHPLLRHPSHHQTLNPPPSRTRTLSSRKSKAMYLNSKLPQAPTRPHAQLHSSVHSKATASINKTLFRPHSKTNPSTNKLYMQQVRCRNSSANKTLPTLPPSSPFSKATPTISSKTTTLLNNLRTQQPTCSDSGTSTSLHSRTCWSRMEDW